MPFAIRKRGASVDAHRNCLVMAEEAARSAKHDASVDRVLAPPRIQRLTAK